MIQSGMAGATSMAEVCQKANFYQFGKHPSQSKHEDDLRAFMRKSGQHEDLAEFSATGDSGMSLSHQC